MTLYLNLLRLLSVHVQVVKATLELCHRAHRSQVLIVGTLVSNIDFRARTFLLSRLVSIVICLKVLPPECALLENSIE